MPTERASERERESKSIPDEEQKKGGEMSAAARSSRARKHSRWGARGREGGAHAPSRERGEKCGEYDEVAIWKSLALLDDADLHTTVVLLRNDA